MTEIKIIRSKRKTLSLEVKENGEVVLRAPFWCSGKTIDAFVNEKIDWLKSALERQKKISENKVQLDDKRIAELKRSAKILLPERVNYYSKIMGVEPTGIKITSAQKRFGSCSTKNSICFSYLLMLYPQEAIDYVVVHELAHIRFHNHSKDFYGFIESVLPDYRNREKLLKGFFMN
ncbi:MAG: SprT family zinc-dependent metalloprotease [Acutalibacteraceae bacterium]|nr:SprT family zinc-dependent metalloprotease [Acutalibacteraceae bacterium]